MLEEVVKGDIARRLPGMSLGGRLSQVFIIT
jgi:hypothetical protein